MAHQDYSTQRRIFQYLTQEKQAQIEILLHMKVPKSRIAREVGIARSRCITSWQAEAWSSWISGWLTHDFIVCAEKQML